MRLKLVNAVLYAGIAVLAASIIGAPLRMAVTALSKPFSYAPDLEAPWSWLAIGLTLVLVVASATGRIAQGLRAGMIRYALLLLVLVAALAARKLVGTPDRPTVGDALSHLVARAELAADAVYTRQKAYPLEPSALTTQWPQDLLDLGYFRQGAVRLQSKLYVVPDTFGPVLVPPAQVKPGDLVFAVSADRKRYWLTAFVLDRAGRIVPFTDSAGRAVVASAFDGRPASRLDPLFPEYPNKLPPPASPM